mgnify:CR=1 FL=1
MSGTVLGLDIGGTKIAAGLVDADGEVTGLTSAATPIEGGQPAIVAGVLRLAQEVRRDTAIDAVGVGTAGVVDPLTQIVSSATDVLPGWRGADLAAPLSESLGVPVTVINDVHAHGLGEAHFGAGRGRRSVLVVAAGTGIGGAIVVDGHLMTGESGAAGHIGHVSVPQAAGMVCSCGRTGHVEAIASGAAMARNYQAAAVLDRPLAAAEIVRLVSVDDRAREVVTSAGFALGVSVGGLVNTLNPSVVVVTGGLAGSPQIWWDSVRGGFAETVLPALAQTPIVAGGVTDAAGVIGAAYAARQGAQPC